jgi:hypothetical protein
MFNILLIYALQLLCISVGIYYVVISSKSYKSYNINDGNPIIIYPSKDNLTNRQINITYEFPYDSYDMEE